MEIKTDRLGSHGLHGDGIDIRKHKNLSSFTKPYVPSTILRLDKNHPKVPREALKTRKSFFFLPAHRTYTIRCLRECVCVSVQRNNMKQIHMMFWNQKAAENHVEWNWITEKTILTVECVVLVRDWMETKWVCESEAKIKEREILSARVFHHPSHKHFRKIFARWQVTAFEFLELVCFAFASVGLNFKWGSIRCMFPSRTAFH